MVKFTADELRRIMDYKHNMRNMSVVADIDHEVSGDVRTRPDEADKHPQPQAYVRERKKNCSKEGVDVAKRVEEFKSSDVATHLEK